MADDEATTISVNSSKFEKLDDTNYETWSIMMEAELVRKGLFDGIVVIDEEDAAKFEQKKKTRGKTKMAQARAEMILKVHPSQLAHMRNRDPMEIWDNLQQVHQSRGFASSLSLRRAFLTAKKGPEQSMQSWIGFIQAKAFVMEQAGITVSDQDKILALTMGLPKAYDPVIINFDATKSDDLTFHHVVTRLLNEETRQKSDDTGEVPSKEVAFAITSISRKSSSFKPKPRCFFCEEEGHMKSECPVWKGMMASFKKMPAPETHHVEIPDADDLTEW